MSALWRERLCRDRLTAGSSGSDLDTVDGQTFDPGMTSAAEARRWAAEHVQPAAIGWDEHGRRVADEAPPVTSVREQWFHDHGLSAMFPGDGTMRLDEAGLVRYRRVRDLPDGSTAYERF